MTEKDSTLEINGLLSTNQGKVQSFDPLTAELQNAKATTNSVNPLIAIVYDFCSQSVGRTRERIIYYYYNKTESS